MPVHWLRANESEWSPPAVVFFDTETHWQREPGCEVHRMRLWAACGVDRRAHNSKRPGATWGFGETPAELAAWLDGFMVGRDTVWCYAHNLGFDLTVAGLPNTLVDLGWAVNDFSVGTDTCWLRLGRRSKTLTFCDSWSWLPQRLESLATLMGRRKVDLPANDGGAEAWRVRCAVDVELLGRSVLALMDWWDAERLGRWTITGAGCGWNAMRHIAPDDRLVVDVTPELVAADRRALYGGRRDSAVVRRSFGGPWAELDLVAAYPTVAREVALPFRRMFAFEGLAVDDKMLRSRMFGAVADCVVRTNRPRYPVRHAGVTWYPVGTFKTALAGPELRWASESGELVSVGAGQCHQLGFALRRWATWVLDPSEGGSVEVPPVAKVAAKAWSRSVLGKFAARSHSAEPLEGVSPYPWRLTESYDRPSGHRAAEVHAGGRAWYATFDQDSENCYPAVFAWVASEVRVRLSRVLEALEGAWWTADTDGLIVDLSIPEVRARAGVLRFGDRPADWLGLAEALCGELAPLVAPLTLRPKRVIDSLAVLGPQHLTAGGVRKMAGVSGSAAEVAPDAFVGFDWPGLRWQMAHSAPGAYVRPERASTFRAPTVHRWVLADGSTRPPEMALDADGANRLLSWGESRWAGSDAALAPAQYPTLGRLVS